MAKCDKSRQMKTEILSSALAYWKVLGCISGISLHCASLASPC